jgi:hypothetical protein
VLKQFGYGDSPVDSAYKSNYNLAFLNHVRSNTEPSRRWSRVKKGRPSAVEFWYREILWRCFG